MGVNRVSVPGATKDHYRWAQGEQLEALYEQYDHPLYKRLNQTVQGSGHGGMDGLMMVQIIQCLQQGLALDQNVYEGCYGNRRRAAKRSLRSLRGDAARFSRFYPWLLVGDEAAGYCILGFKITAEVSLGIFAVPPPTPGTPLR